MRQPSEIILADGRTLQQVLDLHVLWLKGSGGERADLSWADLTGANLFKADLSWADLAGANLFKADLSKANLYGANLFKANLFKANLYGANLFKANLFKADLTEANLTEANLTEANLTEANLTEANLTEANLTEANLTEADLSWADLFKANLTEAPTPADIPLAQPKSTEALRFNEGKIPYGNLPLDLLDGAARAMFKGEQKYSRANYRKGYDDLMGPLHSLLRHVAALQPVIERELYDKDGPLFDAESGESHVHHVITSALILIQAMRKKGIQGV
jgi:Pentapeptide repeats (8 copies)/Domain of unknown function (DUF5664)